MLLFGLAMVVVMLWKPRGFVGSREPTAFLHERKAVSASFTKEGPRLMSERQRWTSPILKVEHLSMKFGGLVAIGDLSFEAKRGDITALIGPNGAGKTTVFNCITGFYKPTEGMITLTGSDGNKFLLERMPDHEITGQGQGGAHLPEHPAVLRHDAAREPAGGAAQQADAGLRLHACSACSASPATGRRRRASIELAQHWLEKARLVDRADDPAGDLPYGAQRRLEIARAMCTGPGAALPRRAGRRPQPAGIGRAQRAAQRHQGHHRHIDPADRARHVGGHGDFRPRRGAGIRPQDLRRRPGHREERPARHRRLSRRRRRGGRRRADRGRRRPGAAAAGRRARHPARAAFVGLDDGGIGDRLHRPQRSRWRARDRRAECVAGEHRRCKAQGRGREGRGGVRVTR